MLQVVLVPADGEPSSPISLESNPDSPVTNDFPDVEGITKVIITKPDGSPLTPEDIGVLEVVACIEGLFLSIKLNQ